MSRSAEQIAPTLLPQTPRRALDAPEPQAFAPTRTAQPIVRIHILGPMRATTCLGDEVLPRGRKARALLGCLCLAAGERLQRRTLAVMMWDRVPPYQAHASFRQAFRELVVSLGSLADELIIADRDTIRLNTDLCWIDALAITAPSPSPSRNVARDLAALCSGELLERLDDVSASFGQWLVAERARFGEKCRALRESGEQQRANPEAIERADIARRLIAFGPTYEGASRVLMRALADMGEPEQAMEEYTRCERALRTILNVEPSAETRALNDAIRMVPLRGEQGRIEVASMAPRRTTADLAPSPSNRNRLRVGVLPFRTQSLLPADDLALSLSQEVASELARFRWFDVIAPMAFAGGQPANLQSDDLMRRNELDYVVDGILSSDGSGHHIGVRLLDLTRYATPVWSDRFELAADEPYRVDEVTARIVAQVDPVILFIEGQPQRRERHGAIGLLLRAIPLMYSMERAKYEQAGALIRRALEEDPDNAKIAAWAAHWQVFHVGQGWAPDSAQALEQAQSLALRAIRLDPKNAEALGIYGHICSFLNKDFDTALRYFDQSLRLNPNLAYIWALSAPTYCYIGQPDVALQRLDRYRELAPFDPYFGLFETMYPLAYVFKGDYVRAATIGRRVVQSNPAFSNGYKPLIAALGHLGRRDEAQVYVDRLRQLEPHFTVEHFGTVYPFRRGSDRERYIEGLRRAGVPER
jgi:DNA-binding SARP family transcriptional activator/Tfp pilus assembly protein PilF